MYKFEVQAAQNFTYFISADLVSGEGTVIFYRDGEIVAIFTNPIAVVRVS
jgi:hypothetical protein